MKESGRRFLQVGVLVFVTTALALSAQATTFSEANLKGSYSFLVNKWTLDPDAAEVDAVGVLTCDGAGHVTGSMTVVTGGVSASGAVDGPYTVNPDGTGVIELSVFGGRSAQLAFVLNSVSAGVAHGFQFVETDDTNNEVFAGTALLQSPTPVHYSLASLKGAFALQFSWWSADPDFYEHGGVGISTFDGKGNLTGSIAIVDNGTAGTLTFTGTYAVNADGSCSMSFVVSNNGGTPNFACALNSVGPLGATAFQLLVTNPNGTGTDHSTNYAITATGVRQSTPLIPVP